MKRFFVATTCLFIVLTVWGCSRETRVNLQVAIEKGGEQQPVSNVKFEFVPYDLDALTQTLASTNNPGDMPARDSMLAARAQYDSILVEYENTLDVLEETEKELKKITDTRSSAYRKAYNKHENAKKTNDTMFEEKNIIEKAYLSARDAYEAELVVWEEHAYAGLEDTVAVIRDLRKITDDYSVKTDKVGKESVVVPGGDWWVRGKVRNPNKKYTVYRWNYKFEAKGGTLPIELTPGNAKVVEE